MKSRVVMVLWLVVNIALFMLCAHIGRDWNEFKYVLAFGACSILVVGTYPSMTQIAEGRRPPDLRCNKSTVFLAYGLVAGLSLASALLFLTFVFSARYRVSASFEVSAVLHCLARAAFHAITEEILFRDMVMRKLRPKLGLSIAVVMQAILFSAVHGFNSSFYGYVNLFVVAIFLALVKLQTGTLWTCIGIHGAWNFFQTVAKGDVFVDVHTFGLITQIQPSMFPEQVISSGMFLCCCVLMLLLLHRNTTIETFSGLRAPRWFRINAFLKK